MTRLLAAGFAVLFAVVGMAQEKKATDAPIGKVPPLDAKEWKKLESGLEIWDVKEGKGDAVVAGAKVTVHYIGWLTNGTKFDSSRDRNETIEFGLGQVIKGWQEGIPGMKPGGVRRLKIPAELAYGAKAKGDLIPANSVLLFEVELMK